MRDSTQELDQASILDACFAFFIRDRLMPVLSESALALENQRRQFVASEILESFLWLYHGEAIGYFPSSSSRRVMYQHFPRFLDALETVSKGEHFETWFSPPLRQILENQLTGRSALFGGDPRYSDFRARPEGHGIFQQFFVLANGFAQNAKARPLLQVIATVNESVWSNVLNNNELVPGLQLPLADPWREVSTPNWTHSGFFTSFEYMKAVRHLRRNVNIYETDNAEFSFGAFLRMLREIQGWRLNFGYPRARDRFLQTGRSAAATYLKTLPDADSIDSEAAVRTFVAELRDLMTDWGASPTPLVRSAGAE
jgi:hypothetical protein